MFHLKGVHHIALNCRDVMKVARFFKEFLEIPVSLENIAEGAPVYFQIGTYTRIGLHQHTAEGHDGIGQIDHIAFSVVSRAELDYLVDKLEAENICYRGRSNGLSATIFILKYRKAIIWRFAWIKTNWMTGYLNMLLLLKQAAHTLTGVRLFFTTKESLIALKR